MKKKNCQAQIALLLIQECAYSKILLNKSNDIKDSNPQESERLANMAKISAQQAIGIGKVAEAFDLKLDALNVIHKINELNELCVKSFKELGYTNAPSMMTSFLKKAIILELKTSPEQYIRCDIRAWFNKWYDKQYHKRVASI